MISIKRHQRAGNTVTQARYYGSSEITRPIPTRQSERATVPRAFRTFNFEPDDAHPAEFTAASTENVTSTKLGRKPLRPTTVGGRHPRSESGRSRVTHAASPARALLLPLRRKPTIQGRASTGARVEGVLAHRDVRCRVEQLAEQRPFLERLKV